MENVKNGSMVEFLRKNRLKENEISLWCRQILEGLQHLHLYNIIYGNLRPTNIVVDGNKNLKLLNFNLSVNVYDTEGYLLDFKIFPSKYVAPELLNGDNGDTSADIWSFGAVLYYIVTNYDPYYQLGELDATINIMKFKRISLSQLDLPDNEIVKACLLSCFKAKPEERATIGQLLDDPFIKI